MSLRFKILGGYVVQMAVIVCGIAIWIHQHRHSRITQLAMLDEDVIGWNKVNYHHYHIHRQRTGNLLQALNPHCTAYVCSAQIDILRNILAEKEVHLLHIMKAMEQQRRSG